MAHIRLSVQEIETNLQQSDSNTPRPTAADGQTVVRDMKVKSHF